MHLWNYVLCVCCVCVVCVCFCVSVSVCFCVCAFDCKMPMVAGSFFAKAVLVQFSYPGVGKAP